MNSLTSCQGNNTTTEAKTMRRDTAGLDVESPTLYQSNMPRVSEGTIVRHLVELDMESLTCCQGNKATGGASTSIRRNRAGQADMKSLTACQGNKARIGERSERHNWTGIKVLTCYQINMFKVEEDAVRRDTARYDMECSTHFLLIQYD